VPPGDASGSGGGDMACICEVLREAVVEFWRDSEPEAGCVLDGLLVTLGRGETGMELRSGAMIDGARPCFCFGVRARAGLS
jgi:hypothetical protein